nr:putative ribonuclease H-like domain-containing protein [Tanacetum cinerariifolium]
MHQSGIEPGSVPWQDLVGCRMRFISNDEASRGFYEFQSNWKQEARRIQVRRNIDNPRSIEEFCLKMVRTLIQLMRTLDKMPEERRHRTGIMIFPSANGFQELQRDEQELQSKGFEEHQDKRLWNSRTSGNRLVVHDTVNNIRRKSSSYIRTQNLYTFSLEELAPQAPITCLLTKASQDESNLWHRRLGHINFRNMNKLVQGNLVRGLPNKMFLRDQTCIACNKGKQHKASYKGIPLVSLITTPLHLLHMDLFGPTSVKSITNKYYCLVITDEFTRFSWVIFLTHKNETYRILEEFITLVENQFNHRVKCIRCDNGTEFKNANLIAVSRVVEFVLRETTRETL